MARKTTPIPAVPLRTPMHEGSLDGSGPSLLSRTWSIFFQELIQAIEGIGGQVGGMSGAGSEGAIPTIQPATDGSFTPDLSKGKNQRIVLTANATLKAPINTPSGSVTWNLIVDEDATGNWVLTPDPTAYFHAFVITSGPNTRSQVAWMNDQYERNSAGARIFGQPIPPTVLLSKLRPGPGMVL